MKLTAIERETILLFNEGEKEAEIYTFNKKLMGRIQKLNADYPDIFHITSQVEGGPVTVVFPKDRMSIRLNPPPTKERSARQAQQMRERNQVGVKTAKKAPI